MAVRMGKSGAISAKRFPRFRSAFGVKSRDVRRRIRKGIIHEMAARMARARSRDVTSALAEYAITTRSSLTGGIGMARALSNASREMREEQLRRDTAALTEFQRGPGAQVVQHVLDAVPALRCSRRALTALPCAFGSCLRMEQPPSASIESALSWAAGNSHESTLAGSLTNLWSQEHAPIRDRPMGTMEAPADMSLCHRLGMCVCRGEGADLNKKANRVMNFVREKCGPKTRNRYLLQQGMLCLRIVGAPASEDDDAMLDPDALFVDEWYHIGDCSFSPWGITLMRVSKVPDPGEAPPSVLRYYIRTADEYQGLHLAARSFFRAEKVEASLYLLEHSDRLIGSYVPHTVPVVVHGDAKQLWPVVRKPRAVGAKAKAKGKGKGKGKGAPGPPAPAGSDFPTILPTTCLLLRLRRPMMLMVFLVAL